MKIIGINLDIHWKDRSANYNTVENVISEKSADLFLLPEMFTTGFCMDAHKIAEREEETLQWMKSVAKNKNAAICGSVAVEDNKQYFNRMYFVKPDGSCDFYDKRHLFTYSGEDENYTAGKDRITVNYKGVRILLQICYDLRFPVFSRNKQDYDVLLNVANWPESRVGAWEHLLKARAIENQAYVFGLNRIGTDGNDLHYIESSYSYFADGTLISKTEGSLITAEVDLNELQSFRNKFPFLNDADDFKIM